MSDSLPLVSIGLITYNRKEKLGAVLESLLTSDYPNIEIIVVDNASSDGTSLFVTTQYPQIKLISLNKNIGTGARNEFLFKAGGKYIIQYDDDSMPENPSTIRDIVDYMESNPDIDVVCTKVFNVKGKFTETYDWERYAMRGTLASGYKGYFVHGSGMVFKAETIRITKGYPYEIFWGYEEGDLALQIIKANLNAVYKPDLVTLHLHDFSLINCRTIRDRLVKTTRNTIWIIWKYFPSQLAIFIMFRYLGHRLRHFIRHPRLTAFFALGLMLGLHKAFMNRGAELLDQSSLERSKWWIKNFMNV